ncbi:hypothetical protein LCGC14_2885510 [marine sediment metagenome]|uniref:Uncharacterized protein n=1 Tax=marine sediment metagenome TaxID=412755 RepID=A0A0F8XYT7_9ZZZZ
MLGFFFLAKLEISVNGILMFAWYTIPKAEPYFERMDKMVKRKRIPLPYVTVRPTFRKGAGRFSMLICPNGHTLRQIPYGEWGDAKKVKKLKCYSCGKNETNGKA